jgi:hypothetical protein
MTPECDLQIELFPDMALSTQLRPAGMWNIGGAQGDFSEGFGRSTPVLRNRLLRCGRGHCDRHRLSNAGLCVGQLFS